jgi:hypothetical protein
VAVAVGQRCDVRRVKDDPDPSLAKLEQAGLLAGDDDPQGNRPRRVYERTPAGTAMLREWLQNSEAMPFELRDIAMVKLFFADTLSLGDAEALLATVKARSEQQIARLQAIRPAPDEIATPGNVHPLLTLELGIAFHEAMVEVCTRFAERTRATTGNDQPATRGPASTQGQAFPDN